MCAKLYSTILKLCLVLFVGTMGLEPVSAKLTFPTAEERAAIQKQLAGEAMQKKEEMESGIKTQALMPQEPKAAKEAEREAKKASHAEQKQKRAEAGEKKVEDQVFACIQEKCRNCKTTGDLRACNRCQRVALSQRASQDVHSGVDEEIKLCREQVTKSAEDKVFACVQEKCRNCKHTKDLHKCRKCETLAKRLHVFESVKSGVKEEMKFCQEQIKG